MSSGIDSNSNQESQNPYSRLGLEPGASFELVQKARDQRLAEVGENQQERAKIEASYDALLMVSLKERQLGKVSNAAVSASQREERKIGSTESNGLGSSILNRLSSLSQQKTKEPSAGIWPELSLPEGYGLTIRLVFGILALLILLISPPESIELILSLSTIGLFISQVRRGRRPLPSLGWSVVLLSIGLIVGGLISGDAGSQNSIHSLITSEQLEALPAIIILWLGTLFLD